MDRTKEDVSKLKGNRVDMQKCSSFKTFYLKERKCVSFSMEKGVCDWISTDKNNIWLVL